MITTLKDGGAIGCWRQSSAPAEDARAGGCLHRGIMAPEDGAPEYGGASRWLPRRMAVRKECSRIGWRHWRIAVPDDCGAGGQHHRRMTAPGDGGAG